MSAARKQPRQMLLASASPRRIQLLQRAGVRFRSITSGVDERPPKPMGPIRFVRWAAGAKAQAVARRFPKRLVVGADTEVVLDGRVFGKPSSPAEARAFLRALSGRTHQVYTAIRVINGATGCVAEGVARTHVTMRDLSAARIAAYVRTGEAQDKAGAYAIQGEGHRLVRSIRGPFDNVVGMPLRLMERLVRESGSEVPARNRDGLQHYVQERPRPQATALAGRRRRTAEPAYPGRLRRLAQRTAGDHAELRRRKRSGS